MEKAQILVVEDESIVALDIQNRLRRLGYGVLDVTASGAEAIRKAEASRPDLVLMDIKLKGEIDGIQAAQQIRTRFDVPVIYVTAYADEATLQRAKVTEPFGYILKPFQERELHTAIEMALYRHKLERELRQSKKWLTTTLKSIGDAVIATDAQGNIKFMNPVAETLTGWTEEEALGKDSRQVFCIIDETARTQNESPVAKVLRDGVVVYLANHTLLIAKDGTETPIADSAAPIKAENGDISGVVLVFHDVTERVRSEALLRESEERLRSVLENMPVMLDAFDAEGKVVFWNRECERVTGYGADEIADHPEPLALIYPQADYRESMMAELAEREFDFRDWEWKVTCNDGSVKSVAWSNVSKRVPIPGWNTWAVGVDVTERVRAEEMLRQHASELQARNEELDAFAHTVAHDLKDPLALIVGFSEVLREGRGAALSGEEQRCLETIARNGRKVSNIIDELLLLAQVREAEVEIAPLEMVSIVEGAQERLAGLIEEHQAEIRWPDTWPVALGYEPWVEEVWVNYLSNGIKYGGRPPRLELGATTQAGGMIRFWVEDNGHGIVPEDQARLFTPFTQLSQVRATGHGLGLSIVRRIVEKLGGRVGMESQVGHGSVFFFTLPAVAR